MRLKGKKALVRTADQGAKVWATNGDRMAPWRILADDLTGALDTAAAWAEAVQVFLDAPGQSKQAVQVVVTGTRDVPPNSLPERLAPSLDWLTAGGGHAFKKVDSLLRGNTLAEIAWLMHAGGFDGAVFAPAFPSQGRFTARGRHWVAPPQQPDGPRSHEYPEPLINAFARVGLQACVPEQASMSLQHRGQVVIPDVLDELGLDDLATLMVGPEARRWLWCGSAGLAWALARREGLAAMPATNRTADEPAAAGRPMLLTASRHPVLRQQWQQLSALNGAVDLIDLAPSEPLTTAEAQTSLAQDMRILVERPTRPTLLAVVGGDTLLALCRAAGVQGLQAGPGLRSGWGRASLLGGAWDGLICHSRSGAFGPPDDLLAMMATLIATAPTLEHLK